MVPVEVSRDWVSRFRRGVRRWYARAGRNLPWVGERDPYAVWVREIMLQQTTVTAVVPYLSRFLDRFPDLRTLASASEDDVLALWEGLGYYSRARNLRKAALMIIEEWGGEWRRTAVELEALPGVGQYTAGAIASFAFDQSAAIVESNTARLFARLMAMSSDVAGSVGRKQLWSLAEQVVPPARPGEFNQALIDLGATVCRVEARCDVCPVRACCRAFERGEVDRIPVRIRRPSPTDVFEVMVVVRRDSEVLLVRHPAGARWGGMWGFPGLVRADTVKCQQDEERRIQGEVAAWGCGVEFDEWLDGFRHNVTRFRLNLQPAVVTWCEGEMPEWGEWVPLQDLPSRPLSVAGRRVAESLQSDNVGTERIAPAEAVTRIIAGEE